MEHTIMLNENLALFSCMTANIIGPPTRNDKTLMFSKDDICGTNENVKEVWFSPTGFGPKDDAYSIGYIRLPVCVRLNEHNAKNYKLVVVSTSVTEPILKDWNKVIELPHVSKEHQLAIFPNLMFV